MFSVLFDNVKDWFTQVMFLKAEAKQLILSEVKVPYWSHLQRIMKFGLWFFNPFWRGSVQSQCSARGSTPDFSQYLGQGYWLQIGLTYCFDSGGNWSTRRKPTQMGRTCKLRTKSPCPSWELNPPLSCYEVTVLTTGAPCHHGVNIWHKYTVSSLHLFMGT